jgi:hypothetical protein
MLSWPIVVSQDRRLLVWGGVRFSARDLEITSN